MKFRSIHFNFPVPERYVDFLKESRKLYDGLNRIGCRNGLSFLLTLMVMDYKQVMRDRTTGSEIFCAGMKDVTC